VLCSNLSILTLSFDSFQVVSFTVFLGLALFSFIRSRNNRQTATYDSEKVDGLSGQSREQGHDLIRRNKYFLSVFTITSFLLLLRLIFRLTDAVIGHGIESKSNSVIYPPMEIDLVLVVVVIWTLFPLGRLLNVKSEVRLARLFPAFALRLPFGWILGRLSS
jgi:hypothetical protein